MHTCFCKVEKQAKKKDPSELLSALDSVCLYRMEDWWTYELCYKKHVRQFHKVKLRLFFCSGQCDVTLAFSGKHSAVL